MLHDTGCAGVMIGRGAIGNPWLFQSIIENKTIEPSKAVRINMYLDHTRRVLAATPHKQPSKAICEMRKVAARYLTGFSGAAKLRSEINKLSDFEELETLLSEFC